MVFPIALGTKTVSSLRLPHEFSEWEYVDAENEPQEEMMEPLDRRVALATSADHRLQAIATALFSEETVEFHIQVSPLCEECSTRYRTVKHRFPCQKGSHAQTMELAFTNHDRALSCLLPGQVILFPLRKSKPIHQIQPNPPSYITLPTPASEVVFPITGEAFPVKCFPEENSRIFSGSMCMAELAVNSIHSLLLLGCRDGSLRLCTHRQASMLPFFSRVSNKAIKQVHTVGNRNGKIVAVDTGGEATVLSFQCQQVDDDEVDDNEVCCALGNSDQRWRIRIEPCEFFLPQTVTVATWLTPSYLATLTQTPRFSTVSVCRVDKVLTSFPINVSHLEEDATTVLNMSTADDCNSSSRHGQHPFLEYHAVLDCIAISSWVQSGGKTINFSTIWHWGTNTEGLCVAKTTADSQSCLSRMVWAQNDLGSSHVVDLSVIGHALRKDTYDLALLSPSSNRDTLSSLRSNALLLSSETVSCPKFSRVSYFDTELEWSETAVPSAYVSAHGSPTLACVGSFRGQSVAVASSRGFCTLHLNENKRKQPYTTWYQFGNSLDEKNIRTISMQWWETPDDQDDLLVVLQEDHSMRPSRRFLSCWAKKMIDGTHQLLRSSSKHASHKSMGLKLKVDFNALQLDLLVEPMERLQACVLLSDSESKFGLYQLQCIPRADTKSTSYLDAQPCEVVAKFAGSGSLEKGSTNFLASASFAFDLRKQNETEHDAAIVCSIGLSEPFLKASLVGRRQTQQTPVHLVIQDRLKNVEVVSFWLADVIQNDGGVAKLMWCFLLISGDIVSWFIPLLDSVVNRDDYGSCVACETAEHWMMHSPIRTTREFPIGVIRASATHSLATVRQDCHKLHRSLGEDFESSLFHSDFLHHEFLKPSSFTISSSSLLPILSSLLAREFNGNADGVSFEAYLAEVFRRYPNHNSFLALQVLLLRLVESIVQNQVDGHYDVLRLLLKSIRSNLPVGQFFSLVVETARQMEPSVRSGIFPLPLEGGNELPIETVYAESLKLGFLSTAIVTLPLFDDLNKSRSACSQLFDWCLSEISACGDCQLEEIASVARDLFKYGMKLDGTLSIASVSSASVKENGFSVVEYNDDAVKQQLSLFCGLGRMFSRRSLKVEEEKINKAAMTFIDSSERSMDFRLRVSPATLVSSASVVTIAAKHITEAIFAQPKSTRNEAWMSAARLAHTLGAQAYEWSSELVPRRGKLPGDYPTPQQMAEDLLSAHEILSPGQAQRILDTIIVLLERENSSKEMTSRLCYVAMIASSPCERVSELAEYLDHTRFWTCYKRAIEIVEIS